MNAPVRNPQQDAARLQAQNMAARQAVLAQSINMTQEIFNRSISSSDVRSTVLNVPIRNVGIIKRFWVEISGTIAQAASETLTRTAFAGSNLLSQITFTDLANQTRIQTTGWHMHIGACARRNQVFGAAYNTDSPALIGSNYAINSIPTTVTTAQNFRWFYEIPIAYGDFDLRGAIFANVVNATMNLQLVINPQMVVSNVANPTGAVWQSSSTDLGTITNFTVKVYQNYLDQYPMTAQGPVLPALDLSMVYLWNNTVASAMVVNQDFAVPFANFRDFLGTVFIYDNFGSGVSVPGNEVNYIALQTANYTNIQKLDPFMMSLLTRNLLGDDFPAQQARTTYYLDTRSKPINTVQYGNEQVIFNFNQVQSSASNLLVGYEMLALQNQITQAGSLYNT